MARTDLILASAPPADPALPAMGDLLDPHLARPLLEVVLDGVGTIEDVRPAQVRHDRGRRVVVRYAVRGRWPTGWSAVQTLVAEHGTGPLPAGATVVGDGHTQVAVWRYPFDPHLPGLAPAAHTGPVRDMLRSLGGGGAVRILPRAYRPTRRAVLQVIADDGPSPGSDVCYEKVVRPSRLGRIVDAHRIAAHSTLVPTVLATSATQGVLVLGALEGQTLRDRLLHTDGHDHTYPAPQDLLTLQRRLLDSPSSEAVPARATVVSHHADVLAALLPDHADRVQRIAAIADTAVDGPTGIVHGDLYEAQVMIGADGRLGLLDLDGLGIGSMTDDCATVLAHMHVLAQWRPARAAHILAWASGYAEACTTAIDPLQLRHRTAGMLLGLAAGGFTAQESTWRHTATARLDRAEMLAGIR